MRNLLVVVNSYPECIQKDAKDVIRNIYDILSLTCNPKVVHSSLSIYAECVSIKVLPITYLWDGEGFKGLSFSGWKLWDGCLPLGINQVAHFNASLRYNK